ncbi:MAG: zinc-binding alcohol dehydrogenase family protein [Synergistetes bacterium]|nr:zinc-binding alcohol dehydrogenase family protein [Synergistota bacterium]MDW8193085.1 zinc-binding alcohol dehydrogenase family protein [Synergistota bacterium]
MKSIVVLRPGSLTIEDRYIPRIEREDEVLIKVKSAGICGSDLHIYHGRSPVATYPRVIGHEVVGEVVEKGKSVTKVKEGDSVVVEPIFYCGECYACRMRRPNVCERLEVFGVHRDGGFQEYIVLPERNVYVFSRELDWNEAVLIEPFTIAAEVKGRGMIRKGDNVFIIGAGPIGLCLLQYLKLFDVNCGICDLIKTRLKLAEDIGADFVIDSKHYEIEEVLKYFSKGANVVIDAVGLPETFEKAVKIASPAGRVIVLGFDNRPSMISQVSITLKGLTILGSRLQAYKFSKVIELFNSGRLRPKRLITHVFSFKEVLEAFNLIENYPEKVCKVVLNF